MSKVGTNLVRAGHVERGAAMLRHALLTASARGAKFTIANILWSVAEAVERDGDRLAATELLLAAVAVYDTIGSLRTAGPQLLELGEARAWFERNQAQYERAIADKRVLSIGRAIELALGHEFGPAGL